MSKILRPLSNLSHRSSRHSAGVLRHSYSSLLKHNGEARLQQVHVKPTWAKRASKRVLLSAVVSALVAFYSLDLPWGMEEEKAAARGERTFEAKTEDATATTTDTESTEEDDFQIPEEKPENAVFIPLGFTRQLPHTFYKGTDPEWQSFMEFAKNKQRTLAIRNELAGLIGQYIGSMKNFQKHLGQPIQPRKYWLDIDFPDGPPPEYERSGLEISEDYVAWVTRPVDPIQVARLQSVLWPRSIAISMWSSYSTLVSLQVARAKQFLGIDDGGNPDSTTTGLINFQPIAKGSNQQEKYPEFGADLFDDPDEAPAPTSPSPNLSSADGEKSSKTEQSLENIGVGLLTDFSSAFATFKRSISKTWELPHIPPERGTVMVSGLVELVGSKATCVIDVRAAFHPKENRWMAVGVGVRRLQAKKQSPKGGK